VTELPGGGWFGGEVSPDERLLAMTRYLSASESEVWLIDLADGQRRRLLPGHGETLRASLFVSEWTPDGSALLLASDRAGEYREAMRLDLSSGALTRLSAGTPWDTGEGRLSSDGRWLAFTANVDGRDELHVLDRGAGHALPAFPGGSVGRIAFHRARPQQALVVNSAQGPSQVHSVDLTTGAVQAWTRPSADPALDLSSIPDQQIVRRLQARGTPVWYLLADNEGHGFARRENADFHFAALATFIEQTLLR